MFDIGAVIAQEDNQQSRLALKIVSADHRAVQGIQQSEIRGGCA
jgi:hypothetical protein